MVRLTVYVLLSFLTVNAGAQAPLSHAAGKAEASVARENAELHNGVISASWEIGNSSGLRRIIVQDRLSQQSIPLDHDDFVLLMRDGTVIRSSRMTIVRPASVEATPVNARASLLAEHFPGRQIAVELQDQTHHLRIHWRGLLRDNSNYLREQITIRALNRDASISEIRLISVSPENAEVVGSVKGSPIVAGNDFLGFEHPLSACSKSNSALTCSLARELPLRAGQQATYSAVIGVTRHGQLRRDFLAYVERERAHPYRTFLHYNTWYDLGYFGRYDEAGVLDRIHAFGEELKQKRGVKIDSFLMDDGWDDPKHLWHFDPGFSAGFKAVQSAAGHYGAAPGVWLSPWGGYGKPKQQRMQSAHESGFETYQGGLALSGPRYFDYFRQVCFEMINRYGANQFKFDGTGNANRVIAGSRFDSDFDAAISLISQLRSLKPDLYVNLTTGTYPSPFWLLYADSIWRGGEDHDFAGVGTARQRWITYRDGDTYEHVVKMGPLFPLNSLMLHGLIYAQHAKDLDSDAGNDFPAEVHSYFGTGTQLQEMYITPALLTSKDWDVLASAAKWSRENADILRDTHWIGGNPLQLQVYGWAAWSPHKAILTLRNPSDHAQSFDLDPGKVFELSAESPQRFHAHSVWTSNVPVIELSGGHSYALELKPFEVLTLEADPIQ